MNRRTFLCGLTLGTLSAPLATEARQAGKTYRVGWLTLASPSTFPREIQAFREGMRGAGHVEGQHYVLDIRSAGGKADSLAEVARELVALDPDVILVGSATSLFAATAATKRIPIVIAGVADPVQRGVAMSLARPGGNVTGLSIVTAEGIGGKWLEFLREVVPDLSRILVLRNAATQSPQAQEIEVIAKGLGIAFLPLAATSPGHIETGFAKVPVRRGDGLIVFSDATTWGQRARIVELAARKKLPAIYTLKVYVEAGGLMSYAPNLEDIVRRSAVYVDKILRGAKPGDIPIEQPTKFELVINLRTAKALGLTIPPSIMLRADQVIE